MMLCAVGGLLCSVNVMGAYPFIPAYFAALYLEMGNGVLLIGCMGVGIALFVPMTAGVKYLVALFVIWGAIRLVQWANEGCPALLAGGTAAVITMILSFAGGLLAWKDQLKLPFILLEGVFIFGAVVLLNRLLHALIHMQVQQPEETRAEPDNGERLRGYAESFQGLSQIFYSMSKKKNTYPMDELGQVQDELTGKICASCECCALCWERDSSPLYGALAQMLGRIWQNGKAAGEDEEQLGQYCKKSRDMVEEALRVFQRVNLNHAWYNRLLENRQVIAEQLDAMAYIMEDCAREEQVLDAQEKRSLAEIRYQAKEQGIVVEELHLIRRVDGRIKMEAALRSRFGGCISLKPFLRAAEHTLGKNLRATADARSFIGKESAKFVFYEDTNYRSVQGIARLKKDDAKISGDNFSFLELDRGELLLGLSDGMGSGSTACKESEMVLDLVERFMAAGFSVETAIRMMNSAMVMKGENDLYSTVDLCRVDLYSGVGQIYKIGAAATFIKRKDGVECIRSESLPVGVQAGVEIETHDICLSDGDFVVMVTDGVLEYLHVPKPEDTIKEVIGSIQTNNPGILAKRIMERVLLFTGGHAKDDMTVLAACIWEKS